MALIIEDGTIVPNSNSYVSVQDVRDYAEARGSAALDSLADAEVEPLIISAMDYIESLTFQGNKVSVVYTTLQWPRYDVFIDGYSIPSNTVPPAIKNAVSELVLLAAGTVGYDPLASSDRKTSRETVGAITVQYEPGSSDNHTKRFWAHIHKYVIGGGLGSINFNVNKG